MKGKFNPFIAAGPAILVGATWFGLAGHFDRKSEGGNILMDNNTNSELVLRAAEKGSLEKVASVPVPVPVPVSSPVSKNIKRIPISYKTNDGSFSGDSDKVLLARMIYGEARGEADSERIAIAYTVLNRISDGKKWNGESVRGVLFAPGQYHCFNADNLNRKKLMDPENEGYSPKEWKGCLNVAEGVLGGKFSDPTRGATNYFTGKAPEWASKMERAGHIDDGPHVFYRPATQVKNNNGFR